MRHWALERWQHHTRTGGVRQGLARAAARMYGVVSERARLANERLVALDAVDQRLTPPMRAMLFANRRWAGRFAGKPALIVGSGPSAERVSPSIAAGRAVFAVNEMFEPLQRQGIPIAGIAVSDPLYFDGSAQHTRMLQDVAAAAAAAGAVFVVPAEEAAGIVRTTAITNDQLLPFVISGSPVTAQPGQPAVLDLARPIPVMPSVAHAALAAAMYLGCTEIVLIGVDLGYVAEPSQPIRHAYGRNRYVDYLNSHSAADAYQVGHGWNWSAVLRDVATQLDAYAWMADAAKRDGRQIVNLSETSLLRTVPNIIHRPAP